MEMLYRIEWRAGDGEWKPIWTNSSSNGRPYLHLPTVKGMLTRLRDVPNHRGAAPAYRREYRVVETVANWSVVDL